MSPKSENPPTVPDIRVEKYLRRFEKFSPEIQEMLSNLSSQFLEHDIYLSVKSDPEKIKQLAKRFTERGLSQSDLTVVMNYFNLGIDPESFSK